MTTLRRLTALAVLAVLLAAAGCGGSSHPSKTVGSASPGGGAASTGSSSTADDPGEAALAAGRDFSTVFFSPDYRTLQDYDNQVEAGTTGSFRSDFVAKEGQLQQLLTQVRSTATGHVLAAAVRDVTPSTANVLVVADQDVQNTTTKGKQVTNRYRVAERLRLIGGRWLIEDLESVTDQFGTGCPDPTATQRRNTLLSETCDDITQLYSYDYRHIDADIAKQGDLTLGTLHTQITTQSGPSLRELAPRTHAVVQAIVGAAAIERLDGDQATVLLFLNQAVSSNLLPAPRLDRNRLEATMQRVDGRWLVADIRAL